MCQGKHCFLSLVDRDGVIQYVLTQRDIVEKLTVSVLGVYLFYTQTSSGGPGPRFIWPKNAFLVSRCHAGRADWVCLN